MVGKRSRDAIRSEVDDEVRFTPSMYLEHILRERAARGLPARLEDFGVAPLIVGTWFRSVTELLVKETGAQPATNWPGGTPAAPKVYTGETGGTRVSFVTLAMGAPGTVAELEDLVAAGARRIIGLGMAGSLQPEAPVGSVLLPTECIREEGTSAHYLSPTAKVGPEPGLMEELARAAAAGGLAVRRGPHWTTDAPYREFVRKIEQYREAGVLGVDMETSAMYALGRFRGVAVANLLVVSDELWRDWRPAFETDELKKAMRKAALAVAAGVPALARAGSVTY